MVRYALQEADILKEWRDFIESTSQVRRPLRLGLYHLTGGHNLAVTEA